jgi:hypothetical protein
VNLKALPYRLDDVAGSVAVAGSKVTLTDLTAPGTATPLKLSGTARSHAQQLGAEARCQRRAVDDAFKQAVPSVLRRCSSRSSFKASCRSTSRR